MVTNLWSRQRITTESHQNKTIYLYVPETCYSYSQNMIYFSKITFYRIPICKPVTLLEGDQIYYLFASIGTSFRNYFRNGGIICVKFCIHLSGFAARECFVSDWSVQNELRQNIKRLKFFPIEPCFIV